MFRLLYWILAAFSFSAYCLQRQILYSRLDKEVTNSFLTVLYGEVSSLVQCAGLCTGDDYCMEFLYSETSRQCFEIHCVKKGHYAYQYIIPASFRRFHFGKVNNWVEYSSYYYFYAEENVTWTEAKECQKMCAHLVEVETKEESEWLAATFIMKDSCSPLPNRMCTAWTGGNDIDTEGLFVWDHSNTTIGFSNWSPYNPSKKYPNRAPINDCIDIYRNGEWNDRQRSHFNPFICEKIS